MSALLHIKNLIVRDLKTEDPELKRAIMSVFNHIDADLDVNGYETSKSTDEAIEYLDEVLVSVNEDDDGEEEEVLTDDDEP